MLLLVLSTCLLSFVTANEICAAAELNIDHSDIDNLDMLQGPCKDQSDQCGACKSVCGNEAYSHWTWENCAVTCGHCSNALELELQLREASACWNWNTGYTDIIKEIKFTSIKDCQNACLAEEGCVGAHINEYSASYSPGATVCALAKSEVTAEKKKYFSASLDCMKGNQGVSCQNYIRACTTWSNYCVSKCPYIKNLMFAMCPEQCDKCPAAVVQWTEEKGKKLKGTVLKKGVSADTAKAICEGMADCKAMCCKKKKCDLLSDTKKKMRDNAKFNSYIKSSSKEL